MKKLELLVFSLCFVLCLGELSGPDYKKETEDEDEEGLETVKGKEDNDYIKELTDAVNKEIITLQEYADAINKRNKNQRKEDDLENKGKLFKV